MNESVFGWIEEKINRSERRKNTMRIDKPEYGLRHIIKERWKERNNNLRNKRTYPEYYEETYSNIEGKTRFLIFNGKLLPLSKYLPDVSPKDEFYLIEGWDKNWYIHSSLLSEKDFKNLIKKETDEEKLVGIFNSIKEMEYKIINDGYNNVFLLPFPSFEEIERVDPLTERNTLFGDYRNSPFCSSHYPQHLIEKYLEPKDI